MILQTSQAQFLFEQNPQISGAVKVFSDNKEELHRLFVNSEIQDSEQSGLKYSVDSCRQELAHVLILLVKEIESTGILQSNLDFA